MDLEQFAKDAGVELVECGPEWGGRIGYTTKDYPAIRFSGFRSANAAYGHWLDSTFGEQTAKAVKKLIKAASRAPRTASRPRKASPASQ